MSDFQKMCLALDSGSYWLIDNVAMVKNARGEIRMWQRSHGSGGTTNTDIGCFTDPREAYAAALQAKPH